MFVFSIYVQRGMNNPIESIGATGSEIVRLGIFDKGGDGRSQNHIMCRGALTFSTVLFGDGACAWMYVSFGTSMSYWRCSPKRRSRRESRRKYQIVYNFLRSYIKYKLLYNHRHSNNFVRILLQYAVFSRLPKNKKAESYRNQVQLG